MVVLYLTHCEVVVCTVRGTWLKAAFVFKFLSLHELTHLREWRLQSVHQKLSISIGRALRVFMILLFEHEAFTARRDDKTHAETLHARQGINIAAGTCPSSVLPR